MFFYQFTWLILKHYTTNLTLPTAKSGGFLLPPPLHWRMPYGIAMSYTVSTSQIILFPYALRCSFLCVYSDCSDTWLVFLPHHSHTRQIYMQAYQKTYSTMQNRYVVPTYDYTSYFLLFLSPDIYTIGSYLSSILWTPYQMVFTGIDDMVVRFVCCIPILYYTTILRLLQLLFCPASITCVNSMDVSFILQLQ